MDKTIIAFDIATGSEVEREATSNEATNNIFSPVPTREGNERAIIRFPLVEANEAPFQDILEPYLSSEYLTEETTMNVYAYEDIPENLYDIQLFPYSEPEFADEVTRAKYREVLAYIKQVATMTGSPQPNFGINAASSPLAELLSVIKVTFTLDADTRKIVQYSLAFVIRDGAELGTVIGMLGKFKFDISADALGDMFRDWYKTYNVHGNIRVNIRFADPESDPDQADSLFHIWSNEVEDHCGPGQKTPIAEDEGADAPEAEVKPEEDNGEEPPQPEFTGIV